MVDAADFVRAQAAGTLPPVSDATGRSGRNKYNAIRTEVNGVVLDSKAEARRYEELLIHERAGAIRDLQVHPRYPLHGGRTGILICTYVADFAYIDALSGGLVVEDVKGAATRTPSYQRNVRMLWDEYGVLTTEALTQPRGGWLIRPAFTPQRGTASAPPKPVPRPKGDRPRQQALSLDGAPAPAITVPDSVVPKGRAPARKRKRAAAKATPAPAKPKRKGAA